MLENEIMKHKILSKEINDLVIKKPKIMRIRNDDNKFDYPSKLFKKRFSLSRI